MLNCKSNTEVKMVSTKERRGHGSTLIRAIVLLVTIGWASAFYLPGLAPVNFCKKSEGLQPCKVSWFHFVDERSVFDKTWKTSSQGHISLQKTNRQPLMSLLLLNHSRQNWHGLSGFLDRLKRLCRNVLLASIKLFVLNWVQQPRTNIIYLFLVFCIVQ